MSFEIGDELIDDSKAIADSFNSYFCYICKKSVACHMNQIKRLSTFFSGIFPLHKKLMEINLIIINRFLY